MKNKNTKSSTGRLSWMLSGVLKSKRAEGYVDTAVKVLIAVVIGALLLFGLYGLFNDVVLPTTTSKVSSLFNATGAGETGGGGGTGGDIPVTPDPGISREDGSIIPDGATYTIKASNTVLTGNGTAVIPNVPGTGDTYEEGDYKYTYNKGTEYFVNYGSEWCVDVKDRTKSEYGTIISDIAGKPITHLTSTFRSCESLSIAPTIPNSVTDMKETFKGCKALVDAPVIPNGVTNMQSTFLGCDSITAAPVIPVSVTNLSYAFADCIALNTAPVIPNNVTSMECTFGNCKSLVAAPIIPNSVTCMRFTFQGCTSLVGTAEINASPEDYDYCFVGTTKSIKLIGSSTKLAEIAATATNGNVTVK